MFLKEDEVTRQKNDYDLDVLVAGRVNEASQAWMPEPSPQGWVYGVFAYPTGPKDTRRSLSLSHMYKTVEIATAPERSDIFT